MRGKRWCAALVSVVLAGSYAGAVFADTAESEIQYISDNEDVMQIVEGSNSLGRELTAKLVEDEIASGGSYVFISPYSIVSALSILAECSAEGEQIDELRLILGQDNMEGDRINESQALLLDALQPKSWSGQTLTEEQKEKENACTVEIANALYVDDEAVLVPEFDELPDILAAYQPEIAVKALEAEEIVGEVNAWVQDKTHEMIDSILDKPLGAEAALLVMNAVYFKGFWVHSFDENLTEFQPFSSPFRKEKIAVEVPMMHLSELLAYAETDEYQIVQLPYRNYDYTMMIYLPKDMYESQKWTDEEYLTELLTAEYEFDYKSVNLSMPKFETEYQVEMKKLFEELGMEKVFEPVVYDRLCEDEISVNRILHKTALNVDENGTEASAVTALMLDYGSAMAETVEMVIDHPFYFTITHQDTGLNLFEGCVLDMK